MRTITPSRPAIAKNGSDDDRQPEVVDRVDPFADVDPVHIGEGVVVEGAVALAGVVVREVEIAVELQALGDEEVLGLIRLGGLHCAVIRIDGHEQRERDPPPPAPGARRCGAPGGGARGGGGGGPGGGVITPPGGGGGGGGSKRGKEVSRGGQQGGAPGGSLLGGEGGPGGGAAPGGRGRGGPALDDARLDLIERAPP